MIAEDRVAQVAEIVRRAGLNDTTLRALRETFEGQHFTYCLEDEMGVNEPVHQDEGFNIYLVDGREHCMKLTTDREAATGFLLAQVDEDA